jgi:hypothetical protein
MSGWLAGVPRFSYLWLRTGGTSAARKLGRRRRAVRVEQAVPRTTGPAAARVLHVQGAEAEQAAGKAVHGLRQRLPSGRPRRGRIKRRPPRAEAT